MSNKYNFTIVFLLLAVASFPYTANYQIADSPDDSVADIPVNYTEAKVGDYMLDETLTLTDGKPVSDAKTWYQKRRPEIVRLFDENQFGRCPDRLAIVREPEGTPSVITAVSRQQIKYEV